MILSGTGIISGLSSLSSSRSGSHFLSFDSDSTVPMDNKDELGLESSTSS